MFPPWQLATLPSLPQCRPLPPALLGEVGHQASGCILGAKYSWNRPMTSGPGLVRCIAGVPTDSEDRRNRYWSTRRLR